MMVVCARVIDEGEGEAWQNFYTPISKSRDMRISAPRPISHMPILLKMQQLKVINRVNFLFIYDDLIPRLISSPLPRILLIAGVASAC
jgi:hypothetical protein